MTDATQLGDDYLFEQATTAYDPALKISAKKRVVAIPDINGLSYEDGTVTFDSNAALNGSTGYAALQEGYIIVPYIVALHNRGPTSLSEPNSNAVNQFLGSLKCNSTSIIDRVQIEMDNKTIITPKSYLGHWNNLRAMTEWSASEVEKHGASSFLYPDDTHSILYGNGGVGSATPSGNGYANNGTRLDVNLLTTSGSERFCNSGFIKRLLINPPLVQRGTTNSANNTYPSSHPTAIREIQRSSGKGAFVVGTGTASTANPAPVDNGLVGYYCYMLRIRLQDIHPLFKSMDLCANLKFKLTLTFQRGSANILSSGNVSEGQRPLSITGVNRTSGSICPFMLSSALPSHVNAGMLPTAQTSFVLSWGVMGTSEVPATATRLYSPINQCTLYLPHYDLHADKQLEIVNNPTKKIRFLDYFSQHEEGIGGSTNSTAGTLSSDFNIVISGNHKNVKYVACLPYAGRAQNVNFNFVCDQFMSPFDSAPWSCQPYSNISNFQVAVAGSNVFANNVSYDYNAFHDEFSKISALYGAMDHRVSNGLIDEDKWSYAQRILVADTSRISSPTVNQTVVISGTNNCSQPTDIIAIVVNEKHLTLNRITGEVEFSD